MCRIIVPESSQSSAVYSQGWQSSPTQSQLFYCDRIASKMRHSRERRANVAMHSQLLRTIAIPLLFSRNSLANRSHDHSAPSKNAVKCDSTIVYVHVKAVLKKILKISLVFCQAICQSGNAAKRSRQFHRKPHHRQLVDIFLQILHVLWHCAI